MPTELQEPPVSITVVTDEDLTSVADVAQELDRNVLFVAITVNMWRGKFKTRGAEVTLGNATIDEETVVPPRWNFMPKEWAEKFSKVEGKIRALLDRISLRFPIRGIDVIPRSKAMELFKTVDELATSEFYPLVNEFCNSWPAVRTALQQRLKPIQWEQAQKLLPVSSAEIRARFKVVKHVVPMAGGGFEKLDENDSGEYVKEITAGVNSFIQETVDTITGSLHEELEDAVNNLVDRLDNKGVVKGATLDVVQRAFEKMEAFKFVASPEVLAKLRLARIKLHETDHEELNKDNRHGGSVITNGLVKVLRDVVQQANADSLALSGFGRLRRSVAI